MSCSTLVTFNDLVTYLYDYLGENATQAATRDCRRAILNAYREVASAARWTYYMGRIRFNTVAPLIGSSTVTIQYTHTGGTYERMVTLTGTTWPTWAAQGVLVINNIIYQVASRPTSQIITLSIQSNPGADIAAGTLFTLYQDAYTMQADFLAVEEIINTNHFLRLWYEHPRVWISRQRIIHSPAAPRIYTIMSDPHTFGGLSVRFFPAPDQAYAMDAIYQRKPRTLNIDKYSDGEVTISNTDTTVLGIGTAFTQSMIGTVIRFGDTVNEPTDAAGMFPTQMERVVIDVANATSLTVDRAVTEAFTGVKYTISDPVDIEQGAMLNCLLRCCEKQQTITRIMKNEAAAMAAYKEALILGREQDARNMARRSPGAHVDFYRLRDFPRGSDVS